VPVSKKRKKDGKPVHRSVPAEQVVEHDRGPEHRPEHPVARIGKRSNPFVTAKPTARGSQRGR
jgi:hypothetical protein